MKLFRLLTISVALAIALVACGGSDNGNGEPRPTSTTLPLFQQVATPTVVPELATAVATAQAQDSPELNPTYVARGLDSYGRLECATCHGENGEGGLGEINGVAAPSLVGLALTQDEFIDWMRTGGGLGNAHLYSTDRLSDSGGRNLYQYLISLGAD